jgi:hypothetical protein
MDEQDLVAVLGSEEGLPRAALVAAAEQRDRLAPRFIRLIEDYLDLPLAQRPEKTPIFFIFHLLGDWREKAAYRTLARLLHLAATTITYLTAISYPRLRYPACRFSAMRASMATPLST